MRGAFRRARIPLRPATAPITTAALLLTSGPAPGSPRGPISLLSGPMPARPVSAKASGMIAATARRRCARTLARRPWRSACCFCPRLAAQAAKSWGRLWGHCETAGQVRPSARRWAEQSFAKLRRCDFGSRSGRGLEATSSRACAWRRSCGSQPSPRSRPRPWRSACCFCPWLAAGRPLVHARRQLVAAVETLARQSGSHKAGKLARRLTWAELGQSLDSVVTE